MAELAFQDGLQPALLDRLSDSARTLIVVELRSTRQRLERHGVTADGLALAVRPFGLRPLSAPAAAPDADAVVLQFAGPVDVGTLARVRAAPVASTIEAVPLAAVAEVASRTVTNRALESTAQRTITMRRLRESVLRDLAWLLSTSSYDSDRSLAQWPEVERSVLNFGLPTVAGRGLASLDTAAAAARLRQVIEMFEPRLAHVRVTPQVDSERMDQRAIVFRVEAELWGQPVPQQLVLRTQIDVDSARVQVTDTESG
jgi:type VI secretion system protein ImpF